MLHSKQIQNICWWQTMWGLSAGLRNVLACLQKSKVGKDTQYRRSIRSVSTTQSAFQISHNYIRLSAALLTISPARERMTLNSRSSLSRRTSLIVITAPLNQRISHRELPLASSTSPVTDRRHPGFLKINQTAGKLQGPTRWQSELKW